MAVAGIAMAAKAMARAFYTLSANTPTRLPSNKIGSNPEGEIFHRGFWLDGRAQELNATRRQMENSWLYW